MTVRKFSRRTLIRCTAAAGAAAAVGRLNSRPGRKAGFLAHPVYMRNYPPLARC